MMQSSQCAASKGAAFGARLRHAREAAAFTHEDISARLKIPSRVIRDLESDDWSLLGAPVFVRGQLRSYARLLDLDIESELTRIPEGVATPPVLVSHTHTPRLRWVAEQVGRRAVYIAITAAIAVPVWMATSPHLANKGPALQSLDIPPLSSVGLGPDTRAGAAAQPRTPLVASFASLPRTVVATAPALSLALRSDSWVQVFAMDGQALEQGVLKAGESRQYATGQVGRIVLGDSSAVMVRLAGKPVDLTPFSRANVARFTLSSGGSLAPMRH